MCRETRPAYAVERGRQLFGFVVEKRTVGRDAARMATEAEKNWIVDPAAHRHMVVPANRRKLDNQKGHAEAPRCVLINSDHGGIVVFIHAAVEDRGFRRWRGYGRGCGRDGGGNTKRRSHEVPIGDSCEGGLSPESSGEISASVPRRGTTTI